MVGMSFSFCSLVSFGYYWAVMPGAASEGRSWDVPRPVFSVRSLATLGSQESGEARRCQ